MPMRYQVTANVLNYNQGRFLASCLDSLARQTHPVAITLVDNASPEGLPSSVLQRHGLRIVQTGANLGYTGGHNRGIRYSKAPFVLVLNPDLELEPDFVERMLAALSEQPEAGMVAARLRAPAATPSAACIDSTGVRVTRARKSYDRGAGEPDDNRHLNAGPPFGPSGAAALFKRSMLEDIAPDGQYFDERFFMFREEVDLAWRARLRGWTCAYAPMAVATHVRSYAPGRRHQQPELHRLLQFRNRHLMILKNDQPENALRSLPWLLLYEILALGHALVRERFLLPAYFQTARLLPETLRKRATIQTRRLAPAGALRAWFE